MNWALELLNARAGCNYILLFRFGTQWEMPTSTMVPGLSHEQFLASRLPNYRCLTPLWHAHTVHGAQCYHALVSKEGPDKRYIRGLEDIQFFELSRAVGLRTSPLTREVLVQLLLEQTLLRRP
ncbi:MAG TPA: hypothetical protein VLA04_03255 [Verrucomicrobiae bacterium]|nr:hypothetical protein [Verrucomicrobiae bacterium]